MDWLVPFEAWRHCAWGKKTPVYHSNIVVHDVSRSGGFPAEHRNRHFCSGRTRCTFHLHLPRLVVFRPGMWEVVVLLLGVFEAADSVSAVKISHLTPVQLFVSGFCLLQLLVRGHVDKQRSPVKYKLLLALTFGFLVIGAFIFGESMTQTLWDDIRYGSSKPGSHQSVCQWKQW